MTILSLIGEIDGVTTLPMLQPSPVSHQFLNSALCPTLHRGYLKS